MLPEQPVTFAPWFATLAVQHYPTGGGQYRHTQRVALSEREAQASILPLAYDAVRSTAGFAIELDVAGRKRV